MKLSNLHVHTENNFSTYFKQLFKYIITGGNPPKKQHFIRTGIISNMEPNGFTSELANMILDEIISFYETNHLYFNDLYNWTEFAVSRFNLSEEQALIIYNGEKNIIDVFDILRREQCPIFIFRRQNIQALIDKYKLNMESITEFFKIYNGNYELVISRLDCQNLLCNRYKYSIEKAKSIIIESNHNFEYAIDRAKTESILENTHKIRKEEIEKIIEAEFNNNHKRALEFYEIKKDIIDNYKYIEFSLLYRMCENNIHNSLLFVKKIKSIVNFLISREVNEQKAIRDIKAKNYDLDLIIRETVGLNLLKTSYPALTENVILNLIARFALEQQNLYKICHVFQRLITEFDITCDNALLLFNILKEDIPKIIDTIKKFKTYLISGNTAYMLINRFRTPEEAIEYIRIIQLLISRYPDQHKSLITDIVDKFKTFEDSNTVMNNIKTLKQSFPRKHERDIYVILLESNNDMRLARNKLQKDGYPDLLKEYNPSMYTDLNFAKEVLNKCEWNLDKAKERTMKIILLKNKFSSLYNFTNNLLNNLLDYNSNVEIIMTVFQKMQTDFKLNNEQIDTLIKKQNGNLTEIIIIIFMRVASVLRSDAQILFEKSKVNHNYTDLLYETRYLLHRASDAYELTQSPGSMPSRLISDVSYTIMKDPIVLECHHTHVFSLDSIFNMRSCALCRVHIPGESKSIGARGVYLPNVPPAKLSFPDIIATREKLRNLGFYPITPHSLEEQLTQKDAQLLAEKGQLFLKFIADKVIEYAVKTRFGADADALDELALRSAVPAKFNDYALAAVRFAENAEFASINTSRFADAAVEALNRRDYTLVIERRKLAEKYCDMAEEAYARAAESARNAAADENAHRNAKASSERALVFWQRADEHRTRAVAASNKAAEQIAAAERPAPAPPAPNARISRENANQAENKAVAISGYADSVFQRAERACQGNMDRNDLITIFSAIMDFFREADRDYKIIISFTTILQGIVNPNSIEADALHAEVTAKRYLIQIKQEIERVRKFINSRFPGAIPDAPGAPAAPARPGVAPIGEGENGTGDAPILVRPVPPPVRPVPPPVRPVPPPVRPVPPPVRPVPPPVRPRNNDDIIYGPEPDRRVLSIPAGLVPEAYIEIIPS